MNVVDDPFNPINGTGTVGRVDGLKRVKTRLHAGFFFIQAIIVEMVVVYVTGFMNDAKDDVDEARFARAFS